MARRARCALGTLVEVSAEASSRQALDYGIAAAFAVVARIEGALSGQDERSELSRVNRLAAQETQPISPDMRNVLTCALDVAARSNGCFDPTVGAYVAALGFLPARNALRAQATWRDVELTTRGVRFARPLVLDFDGIAKGYAVDRAVAVLRRSRVRAGRVNAGGDLRVFGPRSEAIHVRTGGPQGIILPLVSITDGSVATSAYGGRRRRVRGRWAAPLIDPLTGLPVMSTRTVSVIAPTCMVADALTKVVALRGKAARATLNGFGAVAAIASPAGGVWRWSSIGSMA